MLDSLPRCFSMYLVFCGWKEYDIDYFKILKSIMLFFFFRKFFLPLSSNLQTMLWTYSASIHIYLCLYLKLSEAIIFSKSPPCKELFLREKKKRVEINFFVQFCVMGRGIPWLRQQSDWNSGSWILSWVRKEVKPRWCWKQRKRLWG